MLNEKFILEITKSDGNIETSKHRSLRSMEKHLPNLDYHKLRSIYRYNKGEQKIHSEQKELCKYIKIYDNPESKKSFALNALTKIN